MALLRILFPFAVLYVLLMVGLFFGQRHLIYFPSKKVPDFSKVSWLSEFKTYTDDNLGIRGWWKKPDNKKSPIVVYFHGNSGSVADGFEKAQLWASRGYGILLAEYRGYGGNVGKPTEKNLHRDARAYIKNLIHDKEIPSDQIILYGESLGAGVALQMAVEYHAKAVILELPFLSLTDVVKRRLPFVIAPEKLLLDKYDNAMSIRRISEPVFIGIAGIEDIVPFESMKSLADIADQPKIVKYYMRSRHQSLYKHGFGRDMQLFISDLER